jgi:hypothetical protein
VEALLVLDENLPAPLAAELRARGRRARSFAEMGLVGLSDPEALVALGEVGEPFVLVTADPHLPAAQRALVDALALTVAVVRPPPADADADHPAWQREVVHRRAHLMVSQPRGSVLVHGPSGAAPARG